MIRELRFSPQAFRDIEDALLHLARPGRRARHFPLYRIAADGHIEIGRLLHDSMQLRRHLPKGFESEE